MEKVVFQSTLPVWGATSSSMYCRASSSDFNPRSPCGERRDFSWSPDTVGLYFNPRSPCGERLGRGLVTILGDSISIHAPRVGSDLLRKIRGLRGAISIHAPRVGSDEYLAQYGRLNRDFNPRSPCGERRTGCSPILANTGFQSTLPVWGATF